MPINKNDITKDMVMKAMKCESAEELMELAKAEGLTLRKMKPKRILRNLPT